MVRSLTTYKGIKFRSKFETQLAAYFDRNNITWKYEPCKIPWQPPVRTYTPDFLVTLPSGETFYVEAKGFFDPTSRSKMACVKAQYPDLDLRFVFMAENKRISKAYENSRTYKEWAEQKGYVCWTVEPLQRTQQAGEDDNGRRSRKPSTRKPGVRTKGSRSKTSASA